MATTALRFVIVDRCHFSVHEIDIPHEGRDELIRRFFVDLDGGPDLLDQAVLHHDETVGDRHGLELVVRHEDRRDVKPLLELPDLLAHHEPEVRIEVGEGLVEQQDLRFETERPGKGDALLLAAGELVDHPIAERPQFDHIEEFLDPGGDLLLRPLVDLQAVTDVFRHGHMGEKGVVLETDPSVPEVRRQVVDPLAVEDDVPELMSVKPPISRRRVVFPHPLGPTNVTSSPRFTSRETPLSTSLLP